MADRLVVLIENDPVLSERIRAVLAAYHLRVEMIQDGNELTLRRAIRRRAGPSAPQPGRQFGGRA